MDDRNYVFPHELARFLGVPAGAVRRLRELELLPAANRVPDTCIFFWLKGDLEPLRREMAPTGINRGWIKYFMYD